MTMIPGRTHLALLWSAIMLWHGVSGKVHSRPDVGMSVKFTPYVATIKPIAGSNLTVTGTIIVIATSEDALFYGGFLSGLQPDLIASSADCNATNGCGVHIHNGTGCQDTAAQGGHYFAGDVKTDPWTTARYSSDSEGQATVGAIIKIGTSDVSGRPFIVHSKTGSRVGCGLLQPLSTSSSFLSLSTHTTPLGNGTDTQAMVSVIAGIPHNSARDGLCYMGCAKGLTANLVSVLQDSSSPDCNATNGCGTHVHNGTACTSKETQGGHFYNAKSLAADPWMLEGYLTTNSNGDAWFGSCVQTGEHAVKTENRPFIVHDSDGSRISCGILKKSSSSSSSGHSSGTAPSAPARQPIKNKKPVSKPTRPPRPSHHHNN